jgi:endonuclease III
MSVDSLLVYYYTAKHHVFEKGYFSEVYFQEKRTLEAITKSDFFREYAWVVLSSGMSEKVVTKVFPRLSLIFNNWKNPAAIHKNEKAIYKRAIRLFNNKGKITALLEMAKYLVNKSISVIIKLIQEQGVSFLMKFKFLGPATALHLAKNVGLDIAKPDRHLMRISNRFGFACTNRFCEKISNHTGDKKSVVDIILWRYATLKKNYLADIPYA